MFLGGTADRRPGGRSDRPPQSRAAKAVLADAKEWEVAMTNLEVQIMNETALSLAGSWEDQRSAQEIVKDIRKSRSTRQVSEGHARRSLTKVRDLGRID